MTTLIFLLRLLVKPLLEVFTDAMFKVVTAPDTTTVLEGPEPVLAPDELYDVDVEWLLKRA